MFTCFIIYIFLCVILDLAVSWMYMVKMYYLVIVNRSGLRASAKCLNCKLYTHVHNHVFVNTVSKSLKPVPVGSTPSEREAARLKGHSHCKGVI